MTKGTRPIAGFRLVRETPVVGRWPAARKIRVPQDVYELLAPLIAREATESFYVLALDGNHQLRPSGIIIVSRGILNSTVIHPREVFRPAITANAFSIILAHNHPSGVPDPSPEDIEATKQLVATGALLDIPVIDHVIVGDGAYHSFTEHGQLCAASSTPHWRTAGEHCSSSHRTSG